MTNTYLLEVFKALSSNERKELRVFLASSMFSEGGNTQDMLRLCDIISNASPDFSDEVLKKERVYNLIYKGQGIVAGKLEKLMVDLNKQIRTFVLIKRYLSDNHEEKNQIEWAAFLRERGLAERSQQALEKVRNQKSKAESNSLDHIRINLLIAEEKHRWESAFNKVKGNLNIPQLLECLDLFTHNFQMEWKNRYLLQQKGIDLPDLPLTGAESYLSKSLLLRVSTSIHEVLKKDLPNIEEFSKLTELLEQYEKEFAFTTLAQYYAFLRSICTLLINGGNIEFVSILHNIHKNNLLKGYFYENGKITPNAYINLVQTAIRAKDFAWAKEVVAANQDKIRGGDEDKFFYWFNMAHCLFAEGKFEEALGALPDTPSNLHYHPMIRRLEVKIYYELKSDLLEYKIDAFRKFIERTAPKTIAANLRSMDLNFLYILTQLSQSPVKGKTRSERLIARIESKKVISDRAWLLEKAKELG